MHLAQGTLSTSVTLLTSVAALAAVGAACYGARREVTKEKLPALLGMSGFIFLAQMINCSMGLGFSGHLLGGALLAVMFGPWSAMLSMAVILSAQVALLGDGSLSTLGANFLNMGVVSVWVAHALFRLVQGRRQGQADGGEFAALGLAAYVSTMAAALSLSLQLGHSFSAMLSAHALIALIEVAGSLVLYALYSKGMATGSLRRYSLKPLALAALLACALLPFSSELPDGLEYSLQLASQH